MRELNNLLGQELTLGQLDEKMIELGFYSIANDGVEEEVLNDESVTYFSKNDDEDVTIYFETTILADKETESLFSSYIKVTEIF